MGVSECCVYDCVLSMNAGECVSCVNSEVKLCAAGRESTCVNHESVYGPVRARV